jgi:hypothetical protein
MDDLLSVSIEVFTHAEEPLYSLHCNDVETGTLCKEADLMEAVSAFGRLLQDLAAELREAEAIEAAEAGEAEATEGDD